MTYFQRWIFDLVIHLTMTLQDMTFDHPDIRHIMINLYRWTSLVVWLPEGIVLQVRIFGHIFFRKSRNLYLRPPVGGRPLSHIQEAAWRYGYTEMLVQNQEPIRTQYFKWSQNYESDPRYHYESWKRRSAKISQSWRRPLLGPSPGWKCLLALSE